MTQAKNWYVDRSGEKRGPFYSSEIRHMVRTGDILPTDLLWREGKPTWVPAGSSPKLFKKIGSQRRSGTSLPLLVTTGLLVALAIVASPFSDLTSGLPELPYLACMAFSGMCATGAVVTFVAGIIGRQQEPMIVPREGRLVRNEGELATRSSADSSFVSTDGLANQPSLESVASVGHPVDHEGVARTMDNQLLTSVFQWVRSLPMLEGVTSQRGSWGLRGALVFLACGLLLMQFVFNRHEQGSVSGEVTYKGKPVGAGLIRFTPTGQGGAARRILAGEIRDGRYRVRSGHGSDGGAYTVQISGFTGVPKQVGPVVDPLGDELFPSITRTVEVKCPSLPLDIKCDSD
jgi:hypothetical protein